MIGSMSPRNTRPPGTSLERGRIWQSFATGGSRGIRESHDYVRQGGATAREMLRSAAASAWDVPASECSIARGVITHAASKRSTTYGQVANARRPTRCASRCALERSGRLDRLPGGGGNH